MSGGMSSLKRDDMNASYQIEIFRIHLDVCLLMKIACKELLCHSTKDFISEIVFKTFFVHIFFFLGSRSERKKLFLRSEPTRNIHNFPKAFPDLSVPLTFYGIYLIVMIHGTDSYLISMMQTRC